MKFTKQIVAIAAITVCCMGNEFPAQAKQLISDRRVGEVLAEVQCGTRDIHNAVRYLNAMGVPKRKLLTHTESTAMGYRATIRRC
jgi:hypothetical protein